MRAVVQRVLEAAVCVKDDSVGHIGPGILLYLGVAKGDSNDDMIWVAEKIIKMRIFPDQLEKMQFPITDVAGSVLVVSQFTLCADMSQGNRPGFSAAADSSVAEDMYNSFVEYLQSKGVNVQTGVFAAHMSVSSVNDGPVTIILDSKVKVG